MRGQSLRAVCHARLGGGCCSRSSAGPARDYGRSKLSFNHFEIIVVNQMQTPALICEAKHHHRPTPLQVVEHRVLPGEHVLVSGGLQEPRATFYIRTGQAAAKELKVPHLGRLMLSNDPHGAWLLRPKGKGSGKGKSDRPVENRERRRLEENKVKREEVASRKTVLLANFTNQIKAIMAKLTDPKVSEARTC
eukprot:g21151.t1